jgi:hypothetical protein
MSQRVAPIGAATPRPGLTRRLVWLVFAVTVAALTFWLGGRLATRTASPGSPATLGQRVASLEDALLAERAVRESLARDLTELNTRVDLLLATAAARVPEAATAPPLTARVDEREGRAGSETDTAAADEGPLAPVFDVAALVAGCMSRADAEALRARWERYELDRLDVNDRAMREGYFMTPRHGQEHAALDLAFRDDLGDDGYDAYLRATGKPNRVALREVLLGGAGSVAGLETGDELIRYAGVRVSSAADLQLLTASGRPGETVAVEVLRDGQPVTLRVARGPLGVVLDGVVRAPSGGC